MTKPQQELITANQPNELMSLVAQAVKDPAFDVAKMRALLDFKRELDKDAAKVEADQAFARACLNMPRITKRGHIDFGKGAKLIPYGKWEDVDAAIRPVYQAEGFTLRHDSEPSTVQAGWTIYTAIAIHTNGHQITASISLPLDTSGGKQNIQGAGSSSSYGVRYSTKLLFNIVFEGEHDDGRFASTQFINLDQMKEINGLLTETKTDVVRFLQMFEVAEVQNLTLDQFAPAVNMLKMKSSQAKGKP